MKVQCELCPKECLIEPGQSGECRVRINVDGVLQTVVYGFPCSIHIDPIEKKPLFHFLPASRIFSIATVGCNLHCRNCQNWEISQANPEDTEALYPAGEQLGKWWPPERLIKWTKRYGCLSLAYTYTDPIIFYEYTYDTAKLARAEGIRSVLVTAGYINREPWKQLLEVVDAANIDCAVQGLQELIEIDTDKRTGVVLLSATTEYPELSTAIVHAYLEELDNYNIHHRRSKAANNEKFISGRLAEVKHELQEAEDTLKSFREKNMNYLKSDDPGLQLHLSRLQRDVELKAGLYISLNQQHEIARLGAAKDIPIVQVLDVGAVPLVKSSPRRSIILLAAFFGSLICSVLLSLWLDLSSKRQIKRNIDKVIASPGVRLNKLEECLVERVAGIACISEQKNSLAEKNHDE